MIPSQLSPLFWDVDLVTFNPEAYPGYTIFRILEYGDRDAVEWLRARFSKDEICQVVRNERRLSARSATFWALVYGIPEEEVAALADRPGAFPAESLPAY